MTIYQRLLLSENLNYAWQKAKRLYWMSDGYIDQGELASFELNLERQLRRIHHKFKKGTYRTKPLRALPRPKKMEADIPVNRQYFHIAVDDQVAWLAVVNALGPALDKLMPPWSYGNRLYRPAWYEDTEHPQSKLELGPYRHASGHLYRKFQHSWPLFRRHLVLTTKSMAQAFSYDDIGNLDTAERLATISAKAENLPYFKSGFWSKNVLNKDGTNLYFASIDLKQFFPNIRTDAILKELLSTNEVEEEEYQKIYGLLDGMLRFRLNLIDVPEFTKALVEPEFGKGLLMGIPTGLFVAGFLANVAMLPVDRSVDKRIRAERSVAHFRFVDDHAILTYSFDSLCSWINWYKKLLDESEIGVQVNEEKYDPKSLAECLSEQQSNKLLPTQNSQEKQKKAIVDTRIDGANPTKLLTKTLGQVSAIATSNAHLLDDKDLEERLKHLEWLLLADIPDREIRPDTRASFAAGQIATLAPLLIKEVEGLVEETRLLENLKNNLQGSTDSPRSSVKELSERIEKKTKKVEELQNKYSNNENQWLHHCFTLLFQAFKEFPTKPRIFHRLHQYCRLTGYSGINEIGEWIERTRNQNNPSWADYYCGLTLQILAAGILRAYRTLMNQANLRSERIAALRHLEDISKLDASIFSVSKDHETWFHNIGKREFAVSALSVATCLKKSGGFDELSQRLRNLSANYVEVSFEKSSDSWEQLTGYRPGEWAHQVEYELSVNDTPSHVWKKFEACFDYGIVSDSIAARRYPDFLSEKGWIHFSQSESSLEKSDSGWVRDLLENHNNRISEACSSRNKSLSRVALNFKLSSENGLSLVEWTQFISTKCSPFDPRRSEWTALEIVKQVITPLIDKIRIPKNLDQVHPNNIIVPKPWKTEFKADPSLAGMSWDDWYYFLEEGSKKKTTVKFRKAGNLIVDYRYSNITRIKVQEGIWERRLKSIGRLLLGLLRYDYSVPAIWNIRGNERVRDLPLGFYFGFLAISSKTLLLLDGCLSGRSAETRTILRQPDLFGWSDGLSVNDLHFDPPTLQNPNELLVAIEDAQKLLVNNQLTVSMNQPRQLIPFNISDFSIGPAENIEAEHNGE